MHFDLILKEIRKSCDHDLLPVPRATKYIKHIGNKSILYSPKLNSMGTYKPFGFSDGAKFGRIKIRRDIKNKPYISYAHDLVILLHELGHHKSFKAGKGYTQSISGFDYAIERNRQLGTLLQEELLAWLIGFSVIWTRKIQSFDLKHKLYLSIYMLPWMTYYYLSYWYYAAFYLLTETK